MEGRGMRRLMPGVLLATAILLAGCLVTACPQSARGAVTASSPSAGAPATPTVQPSATSPAASPTVAPSTASPTATPAPATTAPSPTPTSSSASTSGFGSSLVWLWAVLGALVLLGIILLATRAPARARPSAAAARWRSRAVDAYAKGAALDGAARAAERPGAPAEAASIRWADLQRRADDLTEALYALRETAPTENRRVQAERAIRSLQAARDAMDAQRSAGGTSSQQDGRLHSRLSALESSLNALRVPDDPPG